VHARRFLGVVDDSPSDPKIRNQYLNEFILGAEREVVPDVAVGVKGIYRKYGRVVEDFLCASDGTYCIGNPGEGIMKQIFTLDYSQTFAAPKPRRTFKGVQIDATKRFSNNWQGMASYLWSKLDGNFDGEYAPFTNAGADPNEAGAGTQDGGRRPDRRGRRGQRRGDQHRVDLPEAAPRAPGASPGPFCVGWRQWPRSRSSRRSNALWC